MKEIRDIVEAYEAVGSSGLEATLVTVVRTSGATYRDLGARILLMEGGHHAGLLCGGKMDKILHEKARLAHSSSVAHAIRFSEPAAPEQAPEELGSSQLLVEALSGRPEDPAIALLAESLNQRHTLGVATVFAATEGAPVVPGQRLILEEDGTLRQTLPDAALSAAVGRDLKDALAQRSSSSKDYDLAGGVSVFLETLQPPLSLAIFGGGLDSCPLVKLAAELGWGASVIDPNPAHANKGRFFLAEEVYTARPEQVADSVPLDSRTVAIVITHDYRQDLDLLARLLPSPVAYLGLVGPKRRAEKILEDLAARGIEATDAQRARLFAPAGLDIGAKAPQETALAVLAQVCSQLQ